MCYINYLKMICFISKKTSVWIQNNYYYTVLKYRERKIKKIRYKTCRKINNKDAVAAGGIRYKIDNLSNILNEPIRVLLR